MNEARLTFINIEFVCPAFAGLFVLLKKFFKNNLTESGFMVLYK
jgi:hypothetical protein